MKYTFVSNDGICMILRKSLKLTLQTGVWDYLVVLQEIVQVGQGLGAGMSMRMAKGTLALRMPAGG